MGRRRPRVKATKRGGRAKSGMVRPAKEEKDTGLTASRSEPSTKKTDAESPGRVDPQFTQKAKKDSGVQGAGSRGKKNISATVKMQQRDNQKGNENAGKPFRRKYH